MPTLLHRHPCPACGGAHNMVRAAEAAGREYEFRCPETGAVARLTTEEGGTACETPVQGAVALRPVEAVG